MSCSISLAADFGATPVRVGGFEDGDRRGYHVAFGGAGPSGVVMETSDLDDVRRLHKALAALIRFFSPDGV